MLLQEINGDFYQLGMNCGKFKDHVCYLGGYEIIWSATQEECRFE